MIEADQRAAWDVVVDKLRSFVARRVPASGADVEDIVQDILVRIHTGAGDVADERFGAWVYTVARNAIIDHYRKGKRTLPLPQDSESATSDAISAADASATDDDERILLKCVAPFVARLPSPYREAITLVELEGLTQQAAADIEGVSLSGMKSRVQRGRKMLREQFEACCALTFDVRGRVVDAESRTAPEACACDAGPGRDRQLRAATLLPRHFATYGKTNR